MQDMPLWTPSTMIKQMGEKIANEDSVYYWAAKNDIPVRTSRAWIILSQA